MVPSRNNCIWLYLLHIWKNCISWYRLGIRISTLQKTKRISLFTSFLFLLWYLVITLYVIFPWTNKWQTKLRLDERAFQLPHFKISIFPDNARPPLNRPLDSFETTIPARRVKALENSKQIAKTNHSRYSVLRQFIVRAECAGEFSYFYGTQRILADIWRTQSPPYRAIIMHGFPD